MVRFHLKELIAKREFERGKRITLEEISRETDIHRTTLSKIANSRGYNTTTDNVAAICDYLKCSVGEFMEVVEDD